MTTCDTGQDKWMAYRSGKGEKAGCVGTEVYYRLRHCILHFIYKEDSRELLIQGYAYIEHAQSDDRKTYFFMIK